MKADKHLPLSMVTLVFGVLSVPLAFARQLVVPAAIMAVLAVLFHLWGRWGSKRGNYSASSVKRSRIGFFIACAGLVCSITMWMLWASDWLLGKR